MIMAIWGFVSYIYQRYLDDLKSKISSTRATTSTTNIGSVMKLNPKLDYLHVKEGLLVNVLSAIENL